MPNSLKELRLKTKTPAKDMVAVVQTIYPKYDMTSQSKCENSDAYGICLTQKAMKALYAKFDPDGSIRKHLRTADQHRLKDKLHACRTGSQMLYAIISAKMKRQQRLQKERIDFMANEAIREKAKESGVRLWEVAEKIGVADSTFCRQMRRELPEARQQLILRAIDELAESKGASA